jgi:hypothetical protein
MSFVYHLLVVAHLLGMATIVGSYFVVLRSPRVLPGMLHGALLQLVTGLAMVGLRESKVYDDPDGSLDHAKIGVKLLIALVVTVLAWMHRKRGEDAPAGVVHAIGGLTIANVLVAVLWS